MECEYCHLDMATADSCGNKTIVVGTKQFNRIPYKSEKRYGPEYMIDSPDKRCHDCNCKNGGLHHPGCDMEECPACGMQALSCDCEETVYFGYIVHTMDGVADDSLGYAIGLVWYARVQYGDDPPYYLIRSSADTLENCMRRMRTQLLSDSMKILGYHRLQIMPVEEKDEYGS